MPIRLGTEEVTLKLGSTDLDATYLGAVAAGGGGATEWVPENANIHIDLVNDRAWTEAGGLVDVATLLGHDANTENGWEVTSYDPDNLTADGLTQDDGSVALIGEARSSVLDGATAVIRFKPAAFNTAAHLQMALLSTDGNDALQIDIVDCADGESTFPTVMSWGGSLFRQLDQQTVNFNAVNAFAFTVVNDRFDMLFNGAEASTDSLTSNDRPTDNPFTAIALAFNPFTPISLQSITIYDPFPDTTGLSELAGGGGGGDENVLQLGGENLQLDGEDLTLGA